MEESGASRAQQQTCLSRLPSVTETIPALTVVNNNCATLASVSVDVMGGQGIMSSSRQAMAAHYQQLCLRRREYVCYGSTG